MSALIGTFYWASAVKGPRSTYEARQILSCSSSTKVLLSSKKCLYKKKRGSCQNTLPGRVLNKELATATVSPSMLIASSRLFRATTSLGRGLTSGVESPPPVLALFYFGFITVLEQSLPGVTVADGNRVLDAYFLADCSALPRQPSKFSISIYWHLPFPESSSWFPS